MQMENCISPQKYDLSCLHFSPKINVLTWLINKRTKEFKNLAGKKKDLLESHFRRKNILTYINILKVTIYYVKYQFFFIKFSRSHLLHEILQYAVLKIGHILTNNCLA